MFILYLDASSDPGWQAPYGRSKRRYYVLAGAAINDSQYEKLRRAVEAVSERFLAPKGLECTELKCSDIVSAKVHPWDKLTGEERKQVIDQTLSIIPATSATLFAIVIDKPAHHARYNAPESPDYLAVRFMAPRFHKFLRRHSERGVLLMDPSTRIQDRNAKDLIQSARRSGIVLQSAINPQPISDTTLPDLVETILFSPSQDSPGIQLVDFVAYATWKAHEEGKDTRFKQILPYFDKVNGLTVGLKRWP